MPGGRRKQEPARSGPASRPVSPELSARIRGMARAAPRERSLTLREVRDELEQAGVSWSGDGELLFPQDRTAIMIELDELIDAWGPAADAKDLVARRGS